MPIHVVSYDGYEVGARDAVAITFKDMDTGQVFVETIDHPKYEVWILKKELWPKARYLKPWESKSNLVRAEISYKKRDQELAALLGCDPNDVKYSPLIFGYDIKIEDFYWMMFTLEYGNDLPKPINPGFFDIESDIIQADGFAGPGEAPTSAVTFIDGNAKQVYSILLCRDNLPVLATTNPQYEEIGKIRDHFYSPVDYLKEHVQDFIKELHEMFDEFYGADLQYHMIFADEEIQLHQAFWEIVRQSNIDYLMAWNAPYDIRNLIERPLSLGYEPESIICDEAFKYKTTFFEEDTNVQAHKRNHKCIVSVKPLLMCMMWMYAGMRSGQGKQPSLKLNAIAKKELRDEKLNYAEEGNIKTFMYKNLWKFWIYNIKDVLLMLGIHRETGDISAVYDRCYENGMRIPEAFVSTQLLTMALAKFLYQEGYVMGTNSNRLLSPFDYSQYMGSPKAAEEIEAAMNETYENPDDANDYVYEDDDEFIDDSDDYE